MSVRAEETMLVLRSTLAALMFPGTVTVLIPWVLARNAQSRFDAGPARWLALGTLLLGGSGLLWCITDFAREGRGTLAVYDPPRFVVRGGLYRWVRNPMYFCVIALLLSEGVLFGGVAVLEWAAVVAIGFALFVRLYEEPNLRRRFGADYEEYLRSVPRWIPRPPRPRPPRGA